MQLNWSTWRTLQEVHGGVVETFYEQFHREYVCKEQEFWHDTEGTCHDPSFMYRCLNSCAMLRACLRLAAVTSTMLSMSAPCFVKWLHAIFTLDFYVHGQTFSRVSCFTFDNHVCWSTLPSMASRLELLFWMIGYMLAIISIYPHAVKLQVFLHYLSFH